MAVTSPPIKFESHDHYLNWTYGVRSWLLTTDHKRIGILYMISVTFFFFLGGAAAFLFRLDLLTPGADLMTSDNYNKAFTLHGVLMVFFFLIPAIPGAIGNFVIPLMIGAKDLAFPRLNLASWYVYMIGGLFTVAVLILGGVDTGWTFYPPYSTSYAHTAVTLTVVSVFVVGFSTIMTAINFIVTIHKMRAPGLTWFRLPLFIWAHYATSIVIILGTPVLTATLILTGIERIFRIGIFDPNLGGDPILFQHLFWFYSHPAVYIMVLPAMGVISELITCFSRRQIFGYKFIALSSMLIAGYSFLVWGHHMFVSGQSIYASVIFSFFSFVVAIPSAIKVFNWTATLYKGKIAYRTPMFYAMGFIGLFTIGGLTGLYLSSLAVDVHVHDTYFIVAHFHYIMVGASVMAYLGAIHYWWPKMTGRLYSEGWGIASAIVIFLGFNLTFFPQFIMGYIGMPRRYHVYPDEFQVFHVASTAGSTILGLGYLMPLVYLLLSLRYGASAGNNPWQATGLEWTTTSPPPHENFEETPVVTQEPYAYAELETEEDVYGPQE
jgi:cytochrome c oxidase subunit 1